MVDIQANRQAQKWSKGDQLKRIVWALLHPFFFLSPRPFWGWRRFMLRLFGAKIGRDVHVYPSARFTIPWHVSIGDYSAVGDRAIVYALGPITIGKQVTISQNAHLCGGSHDYMGETMELLKTPIVIEDEAWVCADAFVGPGVVIGERAILGARAVVTSDVEADSIMAGNPAKLIKKRSLNA